MKFESEKEELLFYRSLFGAMNAAVYVLNLNPYKIEWLADNELLVRVLGMTREEILENSETVVKRLMDNPDYTESVTLALAEFTQNPGIKWAGVYRIKVKSGEIQWVLYSTATLLTTESGQPSKAVCIAISLADIFNTPETLKDFQKFLTREIHKDELEKLTLRQKEVLELIGQGKKRNEIAKILSLSMYTIDDHKQNLFNKLQCNSTSELAQYAMQFGLV